MTPEIKTALDALERERAHQGDQSCSFLADAIERSGLFRQEYAERLNVVKWHDMPFERSPDGLIKHIVNERMGTKECCIDVYMQFLPPGKASGIQRHLSEEIVFVVEGSGYDLHWDVKFDCGDQFVWEWEDEPRKFEWSQGDFVYIPPYCAHQHVNADPANEARIIVVNSRMLSAMGFDWFEQIKNADGF